MKQGRASSSGPVSQKREPIPHKTSLTAVSRLGNLVGNHAMEVGKSMANITPPINGDRGFAAPKDDSVHHHKSGSQGRH